MIDRGNPLEDLDGIKPKHHPAITIQVQSWATPVVGIVMLIIGLLGGYYGRPLLPVGGGQAAAPQTIVPGGSTAEGSGNEALMPYLVSQARHFKGSEDAPLTLIEFGDFQ